MLGYEPDCALEQPRLNALAAPGPLAIDQRGFGERSEVPERMLVKRGLWEGVPLWGRRIADAIAENLESKGLVEYEAPKREIAEKIAAVSTADMMAEEALNKDVEKLLSAHADEIARENMDYRKMFDMTKQKLAKERGIVL